MRIVVVRAGALGDAVLTLPALHALRSRYPDAHLQLVAYPGTGEVASGLVDELASIDQPVFAGLLTGVPGNELLRRLHGTDLLVAWTVRDPTDGLAGAGIGEIGHASPYPPPGIHAAAWLIESLPPTMARELRSWGPPVPCMVHLLGLDSDEIDRADQILDGMEMNRPVVLHPGAGAAWKRWPAERFARVGDALRRRGHDVLLVAGPADEVVVDAVQRLTSPFAVLRESSVRHLGALLSRAALVIGNDSGVTHLAATAGAPTIALFGPTDPDSWRPLGNVAVLRRCTARPSRQGEVRVCRDPDCLGRIAVTDVLETAHQMMRPC